AGRSGRAQEDHGRMRAEGFSERLSVIDPSPFGRGCPEGAARIRITREATSGNTVIEIVSGPSSGASRHLLPVGEGRQKPSCSPILGGPSTPPEHRHE